MTPRVTQVRDGSVAVLAMDDGKVNAVNDAMLDDLDAALDAAAGARAIVLAGRDGVFSGGFDLSVVGQGGPVAEALVRRGGQVLARLYDSPVPVVIACTGHAVALGAVMLLATDLRVGADADVAIGLNEVAIGMPLPALAVALAQERLAAPLRRRAVVLAEMWTPVRAVDVGFLDEVVAPESVVATAIDRAKDLGTRLQPDAYATTSQRLRTAGTDLLQA
ncbi:MAG: crotonase/enoyl-CoA hydratase family protein [Jiangellales bacterium]